MSTEHSKMTENLRIRAEELLEQASENFLPSDIEDINKLHHELAVHQAELELQNEELRSTQLSLQKACDRYAELYENAPVGYVLLDASGIIRRTNAAWRTMLGQPDHDFRGVPFAETLMEGDARAFLSRFRSFFHNPAEKEMELRIKRKKSNFFHAHITTKHGNADRPENDTSELMIIVSDINERKKSEEALRESEYFFKESQRVGRVGSYQSEFYPNDIWKTSEVCDEIFGMHEGYQKTVQGWVNLLHPDNAQEMIDYVTNEVIGKGVPFDKEYRILRHADGATRWVWGLGQTIIDNTGRTTGLIGTIQDVTERKQAEEAIKTAHKLLKIKNEEMEQFVSSISHDLKSPLVTVKTFAGMLLRDLQTDNHQQINKSINYIDKAADKMQQLLEALVQYSRIGAVDAPAQTLSADQLVQNCLGSLAGILQQHQVKVTTGKLSQQLHGDTMHFGQIWQNLIENAVKYRCDQPPQIEIGATQEGQDVVFHVRDNGIGIAPEHSERIFNLFSQLNPDSDGSGLGLALVKKLVTIYQGRIWVESAGEGQGSCFMFTLPDAVSSQALLNPGAIKS